MNKKSIKWKIIKIIYPTSLLDIPIRTQYLIEILCKNNIAPKYMAEIGVWRGHSTIGFLRFLPTIETLYAIDPWQTYSDYLVSGDTKAKKASWDIDQEIFNDRIHFFRNKVQIVKELSVNAAQYIPDNSLDFIFIDGNHSYEYVKRDISLYTQKVRVGGLISGHDINNENFPGVKQAVEECFNKNYFVGKDYVWWTLKK